jgi:hypothetical protein
MIKSGKHNNPIPLFQTTTTISKMMRHQLTSFLKIFVAMAVLAAGVVALSLSLNARTLLDVASASNLPTSSQRPFTLTRRRRTGRLRKLEDRSKQVGGEIAWETYDHWNDLPQHIRGAYGVLGWDRTLWEHDNGWAYTNNVRWEELTDEQQDAARFLGYVEEAWD